MEVVAVIDCDSTTIQPPMRRLANCRSTFLPLTWRGRLNKVHHFAGNPGGAHKADASAYWREVTEALTPAAAILFVEARRRQGECISSLAGIRRKLRPDVAAKVVADVRVDIDRLDDKQVLRLAQHYFGGPPLRDFGDGRRRGPKGANSS